MKKRLHIMKNERAFFLPYVLIVSTITLSLIITTIIIYENEVKITNNLIEQIEIETLIQMAREKFIESNVYNEEPSGQVNYTFPNGTVHIHYGFVSNQTVELYFNVVTNNEYTLNIVHEVIVDIVF